MEAKQDQGRWFTYQSRVSFYDTDGMGIVHHANYIRYFEDARLEMFRASGLIKLHHPYGPFVFAVHDLKNHYMRPLKFEDDFEIRLQVKLDRIKVHFQYALWLPREGRIASSGHCSVVPMNVDLKPMRLPKEARELLASMPYDEDWPPAN